MHAPSQHPLQCAPSPVRLDSARTLAPATQLWADATRPRTGLMEWSAAATTAIAAGVVFVANVRMRCAQTCVGTFTDVLKVCVSCAAVGLALHMFFAGCPYLILAQRESIMYFKLLSLQFKLQSPSSPNSAPHAACPPGTGGPTCDSCPLGFFSRGGNNTVTRPACSPCPGNTTTPLPRASTAANCSGAAAYIDSVQTPAIL